MSIGSFFTTYLASAQEAAAQTGWLVSVTLAQWADETGYGSSSAFVNGHNFAGVSAGGGVNTFPTEAAGLAAYVQTANSSYYPSVKAATGAGAEAQCVALGKSPWAGAKYDAADYNAGRPLNNPGIDLINIINMNNLTQYDAGGGAGGVQPAGSGALVATLRPILMPPPGMNSDISQGSFLISGKSMDVDVSAALVNVGIDLNITQASTLTMTLEDPNRTIINNPVFAQASILTLLPDLVKWQLVAVDKQSNRVIVTFEPYVVAALRSPPTQVPFSVAAGVMTRTDFATLLIQQIMGANAAVAPIPYMATLPTTNGQPPGITQEALCRGTIDNIYEDSWTCLQRLASEMQWVCFCYDTTVYFGPQEWLAQLPVALTIQEFQNGILNIDGTFDTGQPLGTLSVNAVAGSWTPKPGQSVAVNNLGPFSQDSSTVYTSHVPGTNPGFSPVAGQNWITATISRASVFEPDIVITLQQAQPSLAEPTGGASAAVAPGIGAGAVGPQPSAQGISWWPVDQTAITQGRIDEGIDFSGSGNLIAAANGTIVNLTGNWPGGGFIALKLDSPPDSVHTMVYYSEYVSPSVKIGDHVTGGQVIGTATGNGIEIGWADPINMTSTLNSRLNGPTPNGAGTPITPEGKSFLSWITSGVATP